MKKAICLLLALLMLMPLSACFDKKEVTNEPQENTPEEEEDRLAYLPDKKFNDDFIIVCRDNGEEFFRESAEGDRVDYAIYMRNRNIEARYGVEIKYKNMAYNLIPGWVSDILKANDQKSMDIVNNHIVYTSNIPLANNALDLQTAPYMDFSKDWWEPSTLNDLTLNGKTFIAIGDMCTSAIGATYCVYYNKQLTEEYKIPDMYELAIEQGDWTYQKMLEFISDIRLDLNKDGKYNMRDRFGLVCTGGSFINAYIWAWDNPIFKKNENTGDLEFSFMKDENKISRLFRNLTNLYRQVDGVYLASGTYGSEMFVNDRAVFYNSTFGSAASDLRDMQSEKWGIVPYPKYNDKQKQYITAVDGGHNAICVPRTSNETKLEKIGIVTEALNCMSHDVVIEFYDKGLKSKYLGDPKEAKAIDLIMDNRVFDFGYIYLAFDSPAFWLQNMIPGGDKDIVNKYLRERNNLEDVIESAYEAFGLTFAGLA